MSKPQLEEAIQAIVTDLARAQSAVEIEYWIATHAEEINANSFGRAFGLCQKFAETEMVVSLSRIFDDGKEGIGVKKAIALARHCRVEDREPLDAFCLAHGRPPFPLDGADLSERFLGYCERRRSELRRSTALARILEIRNNSVAHRNLDGRTRLYSTSNFDECIAWLESFITAIRGGYLGVLVRSSSEPCYWKDNVESNLVAIHDLAHAAGAVKEPGFAQLEEMKKRYGLSEQ